MTPLTGQQERRLVIAAYHGVTGTVERSAPSLARRGLMERWRHVEHGRSVVDWRVTDAGHAEAARIRARDLEARAVADRLAAELAIWRDRAEAFLRQALDEVQEGSDATGSTEAALMALRIWGGELPPEVMDGDAFPGEDPPCTCPPDLVERGGYGSDCPAHRASR